jgi:translation elongation factor EF-1alpha
VEQLGGDDNIKNQNGKRGKAQEDVSSKRTKVTQGRFLLNSPTKLSTQFFFQVTILTSKFQPNGQAPLTVVSVAEDFITFTSINCSIDPVNGKALLLQAKTLQSGNMESQELTTIRPSSRGKSKEVFKVHFLLLP